MKVGQILEINNRPGLIPEKVKLIHRVHFRGEQESPIELWDVEYLVDGMKLMTGIPKINHRSE